MASAAKTVISWTDHAGSDHHGPLIARVHDNDVIACEVCGFRHVIPLPEPSRLERLGLAEAGLGCEAGVVAGKK